jgi:hypothetical protein
MTHISLKCHVKYGKTIGTNKAGTVPNKAITKTSITSSKGDSNNNNICSIETSKSHPKQLATL